MPIMQSIIIDLKYGYLTCNTLILIMQDIMLDFKLINYK
jgi:hypothetical protein